MKSFNSVRIGFLAMISIQFFSFVRPTWIIRKTKYKKWYASVQHTHARQYPIWHISKCQTLSSDGCVQWVIRFCSVLVLLTSSLPTEEFQNRFKRQRECSEGMTMMNNRLIVNDSVKRQSPIAHQSFDYMVDFIASKYFMYSVSCDGCIAER